MYGVNIRNIIIAVSVILMSAGCRNEKPHRLTPEETALINGTGIMRVLQVTDYADSLVLRSECEELSESDLNSEIFRRLSERMIATVTDPSQDGVGIAGPQIGLKRRVVAVMRYDKEGYPFEVYPNIAIEYFSEEKQTGPEGCLSIPDITGDVERSQKIVIRYTDPESYAILRDTVEGYTAVIFQHEVDHLEGILFTDRLIRDNNDIM